MNMHEGSKNFKGKEGVIMKKTLLLALMVSLFLMSANLAYAATDSTDQTVTLIVDEIAVVNVTGNPAAMNITAPTTGGQNPLSDTDTSTSVNYTSTVASGSTRTITVNMGGSDVFPSGTTLKLTAGAPQEGYYGTPGSSAGQKIITASAQTIITGIGSTATGVGADKGCQLQFSFEVSNVGNLVAGENKGITLTYTLTDDQ